MKSNKSNHTKKLQHKFKGRGTDYNPANRFAQLELIPEVAADSSNDEENRAKTQYYRDSSKSIISFNDSPDIYGDASLNIYRGCEHGCAYCYARPTHEYLDWSAGLDFETKILVKYNAPELLKKTLSSKQWKPQVIMLSGNSDCYQPVEKKLKLTRSCLEVMHNYRNPVHIVTKNSLVTRDADILRKMAEYNGVSVVFSITTLDNRLASVMEPQTTKPHRKIEAMRILSEAGIPTGVLIAPVIPGLTDPEIPDILKEAASAGARYASYIMLRLPHGLKELFLHWLETYFPERKQKVINRLTDLFDGKLYDSAYHLRGRGKGVYADQIANMFKLASKKYELNKHRLQLRTEHFKNPEKKQLNLFD